MTRIDRSYELKGPAAALAAQRVPVVVQLDGMRSTGILIALEGRRLRFRGTMWLSAGDAVQLRLRPSPDRPVWRLDGRVLSANYTGRAHEMEIVVWLDYVPDEDALQSWLGELVDAAMERAGEAPGGSSSQIDPIACGDGEADGGAAVHSLNDGAGARAFAGAPAPGPAWEDDAPLACGDGEEPAPLSPFRTAPLVDLDAVGSDAVGSDAVGSDAVGSDAVGSDAVGSDAVDPDEVRPIVRPGRSQSAIPCLDVDDAEPDEIGEIELDEPVDPAIYVGPLAGQRTVRWRTASGFLNSWRGELSRNRLHLDTSRLGNSVRLRLELPDGQIVAVRGRVRETGVISLSIPLPLRTKLRGLVRWCEAQRPRLRPAEWSEG